MLRKLYVLCLILTALGMAVLPASAGISGPGASGIQVQNLSLSQSATISVLLYNQNGSSPITLVSNDSINPASAINYYLPNYPVSTVPSGAYAMVVSASQNVAAIARTDWSASGGAAIYGSVPPAADVSIPLITKSFAGQTSQFTIENADTSASVTDVVIKLYGRGSGVPVVTTPPQTIGAGTSKTYYMTDAMWGALPDTGLDMGATGFVGSVWITSAKDLVVQSFIDIAGTPGVTGFSGVPTSSAAANLYCPLIRANYYGDTGISLVNPGAGNVTATITFRADAGSPHAGGPFTQVIQVNGNSSAVAFQGPTGNSRSAPTNLPGGTQSNANPVLTNDGFYGVASISATGPLLAVVNDTRFGAGWAVLAQSTYNCATGPDAGTKFALPLVRRFHLADTKLTTGIQIQNTSASQVTVHLDLTNWDGTSQAASNPPDVVIPAFSSGNYWNGNLTGLPTVPPAFGGSGWFGSAILTATGGNVVVVVSDEGFGTTAVDSANYNALKIQ